MEIQRGDAAVITGAGSGLGEGLAQVCHEAGMRVVVADIELEEAERVASALREAGGEAIAVLTDVSDPASVAALAARAYDEFGEVHLLCNNAGVQVFKPIVDTSADDWSWVLGVNVHGVIHGIDAFVPRMRQQAGGAYIVNTGSISGCGPYPRPTTMAAGAYITSKYAVVGLSEALHDELEPEGIGVTVLCPAGIRSRIFEAERNRPEGLGGPAPAPVDQWEGMEPREIGRMLLDAVREDRLFVFTETWPRRFIERRHARMMAAFDLLEA